jgi:hypothetical protein
MKGAREAKVAVRGLLVLFPLAFAGCDDRDCDVPIDEGEQLRVTIIGEPEFQMAPGSGCEAPHPRFAAGETFIVTGGEYVAPKGYCPRRLIVPTPPEQWSDSVGNCTSFGEFQFGLECDLKTEEVCGTFRWFFELEIRSAEQVVDDAWLELAWEIVWEPEPDCSQSGRYTALRSERYPIKVDRL